MSTKKIKSKINLALIGAGGMGRRWALAVAKSSEFSLCVVVDKNIKIAKVLAEEIGNCEAITDYRKVLKQGDIQAVIIATPHFLLATITLAALKAKKHVICEKPGAIKSGDILKAIRLAKSNNLKYLVSFNHRFHDAFLKAKKIVDQNVIGKILFIRARYGFGGRPGYEKEWRQKKALGGGELLDQGVHLIDLTRHFLGELKEVMGFAENIFWKSNVDDNAFVLMKSPIGQVASLHASWTNWKPIHSFEIFGKNGYIIIEGLGKKYGGSEKIILGIRSKNFVDIPKEKIITCNSEANNSLLRVLKEFSESIRKKREPKPSGYDALEVLKIVEKIYVKK